MSARSRVADLLRRVANWLERARQRLRTADEVANVIGPGAMRRLIQKYGGQDFLYIPRQIASNHHLARNLGLAPARKLAAHFGGQCLRSIRRNNAGRLRERDAEICRRHAAGTSAAALAREFGLTERRIWSVIAAGRKPDG